ncbi:MAG: ABC transporter ATP-binding protein [Planctomycetota bacterium]
MSGATSDLAAPAAGATAAAAAFSNSAPEPMVVVEALAKTYRRRFRAPVEALRGVSFDVRRGEVFGLLGPNGAGKTTVLKCLLGVVRASGGRATVLGEPIGRAAGRRDYRRRIGYLPEGHQFPEYLTAAQILDFTGALRGTPRSERRARIPGLLDQVGMTPHADKKVREFSKGMKQRTGLAAALVNNPDLLFLDEPTDGVDPVGRRDIRTIIGELCRTQGLTVILNSHMLSEVELVAHRVAIMHQGELRRVGAVGDILAAAAGAAPRYRFQIARSAEVAAVTAEEMAAFGRDFARTAADGFELRVGSDLDLNRLIDHLRGRGVLLQGIVPEKVTLEDAFIQLIGARDGAPADAGEDARVGEWGRGGGPAAAGEARRP